MMAKRHLAITMGDPAGIGPEIIVKACARLSDRLAASDLKLLIIGSRREFFSVTVRSQPDNFHPVRNVARYFQRALADRSSRAQNDDTLTVPGISHSHCFNHE